MDEHVPRSVTEGLRRRGVDVLTVQDVGRPELDDEQLAFAMSENRCVFTQDADFLCLHAAGQPHRGIVYAPQQTPVGELIRGLMLVHDILEPDEMAGHVEFL